MSLLLTTIHYFQTTANTLLYTNILATYTFTKKRSYRYNSMAEKSEISVSSPGTVLLLSGATSAMGACSDAFECDISMGGDIPDVALKWVRHLRCRTLYFRNPTNLDATSSQNTHLLVCDTLGGCRIEKVC